MKYDLLLENCKIVRETGILEGNIATKAGKIAKISKEIPEAEIIINCKGNIVIPGVVDPHVHFREPGFPQKEDFESGSKSAIFGGVTTVLDMPNTKPFVDTKKKFEEKGKLLEGKSFVDYGLYCGITKESEGLNQINAVAYKCYIWDKEHVNYNDLQNALHTLDRKVVAVHPESPGRQEGDIKSETDAIEAVLNLDFGTNMVVFVHATNKESLELIHTSEKITACIPDIPHLFLDTSYFETLGPYAKMMPPIREKESVNEMWENFNKIDCLGTDHAPHSSYEKHSDKPPCGIPGVETFLPLMMNAVNLGKLSWETLVKKCCSTAPMIYGLENKGQIAETFDADLVIIDRKKEWKINADNLHSKCGWTPYDGWKVKGAVEKVILRGKLMVDGDELIGKKGEGINILKEN